LHTVLEDDVGLTAHGGPGCIAHLGTAYHRTQHTEGSRVATLEKPSGCRADGGPRAARGFVLGGARAQGRVNAVPVQGRL